VKRSGEDRNAPLAAAFGAPVRGQKSSFGSPADPPEQEFATSDPECIAGGANTDSLFRPNELGVSGMGGNLSRRRARRLPTPS